MRKFVAISGLSVLAVATIAIGVQQPATQHDAMTADLERDLNLATTVQTKRIGVVSAIERGGGAVGTSGNQPGQRALVLTEKLAPSAALSRRVREVAATPTDRVDPASVTPQLVAPVDSSASASEPVTRMAVAAPESLSVSPVAVAAGGPSSGGGMESDRGSSDVGIGDDRGGRNGRGHDLPGQQFPAGERQPSGVISTAIGVVGVVLRGGVAGRDNCGHADRNGGVMGTLGGINGTIMSGGMIPPGSIPGGPRAGRRW